MTLGDAQIDTALLERCGILHEGQAFLAYARGFYRQDAVHDRHIALKIQHTLCVVTTMSRIIEQEPVLNECPLLSRACMLAALFHDVARFEQFSSYGTFSDAQSCNHGLLGGKLLRQLGFLAHESSKMQRLVCAAVLMHNRMTVPMGLTPELRALTHAVRDADKLDIFRVMLEHFSPETTADALVVMQVTAHPTAYTPAIYERVLRGERVAYQDLRWLHDFRLLVCGWFDALQYQSSRRMLIASGHLDAVLAGLPATLEMDHFREHFAQKIAGVLKYDKE